MRKYPAFPHITPLDFGGRVTHFQNRFCRPSAPLIFRYGSTPFIPEDGWGGAVLWLTAQNWLGQKQNVTFEMLNATLIHASVSSRCKWLVQTGAWVELVVWFLSLFICTQRFQRQCNFCLCFWCDLKEFSGHLRAGRDRLTASHTQDFCEQEPAEWRQLEHAPDKIRRPVSGRVLGHSELLKITWNSNTF